MNTAYLILSRAMTAAGTGHVLETLLDVSLRGSLLLLFAWVATRLLRRGSAALRHLIWASALGSMLLLPMLAALIPAIHVRVLPTLPKVSATSIERSSREAQTRPFAVPQRPSLASGTIANHRIVPAAPSVSRRESGAERTAIQSASTTQLLPLFWAAGALVLLLRLAIGMLRVATWSRRAHPVDDGRWLALVHRLGIELRITRPITLLRSDRACVPMTWGIVYPTVLLPSDADDWTEDRKTIVLLHELAHVKRLDAFTQIVVQIAVSAFWFNPLVWAAARHMRTEREHACDDCVLQAGARASDYAHDLLQIARSLGGSSAPAAAALAMARRSEFEGRLLAILDPRTDRQNVSRIRLAGTGAGVFVLALPLAALAPAVQTAAIGRSTVEVVGDVHPSPRTQVVRKPLAAQNAEVVSPASAAPAIPAARYAAPSDTPGVDGRPAVAVILPSHERAASSDLETLIAVTRAATRLGNDNEKAELLIAVAKHYVRDDELRTAYLDAVATMTSDYDRSRALLPWLLKDSLPMSAVARVVKVVSSMTADNTRADLVVKVASDYPGLTPPVRAALIATLASFTSDYDRGRSIAAITATSGLSTSDVTSLIVATIPMSSDYEKANALIGVARHCPLGDSGVRKAYFRSAETMTSAYDYRRTVSEVLK
jgi:beta-lactamase regulating signal transducer with metallopeptidase domain